MTNSIPTQAIGHIITWQSPTTVMLAVLRDALVKASLDAKLARDLHDYSKLARTARGMTKHTSGSKRIARPVEGRRARQLTRERQSANADGGLIYDREAMLAVDDHGALKCDAPELSAAASAEFALVGDRRTASDVTRLVKRVVESAGSDLMPLRDQGGVYFVPSGHAVVTQLSTLLSAIGGSLRTFACTMGDGSTASVASVVSDYLLGEIKELRASVDELDSDARADVKSRRLARLGELRTKLSAYATLLATSARRVADELDQADKLIVTKLSAV